MLTIARCARLLSPGFHHTCAYTTAGAASKYWESKFKKEGISEPRESAGLIIAHVLGLPMLRKKQWKKPLNEKEMDQIQKFCQLRLEKVPVQYIIGEWDFCDLTLKMRPPVFIPRPETEGLAEMAREYLELQSSKTANSEKVFFLELGCGTGAISLHILNRIPTVQGVAIDVLSDACSLTKENASLIGITERLQVLQLDYNSNEDWETLKNLFSFDLIVSNPPYISTTDYDCLQEEIKWHESPIALIGGDDGLSLIQRIIQISPTLLKSNGHLLLETGLDQHEEIQKLVTAEPDLDYVQTISDFTNRPRYSMIQKKT